MLPRTHQTFVTVTNSVIFGPPRKSGKCHTETVSFFVKKGMFGSLFVYLHSHRIQEVGSDYKQSLWRLILVPGVNWFDLMLSS